VSQLEQLPRFLVRKHEIASRYDAALPAGLSAPPRAPWADPSLWLYTVLVDRAVYGRDRNALLAHLAEGGVQARPIWSPLHTMPMFAGAPRLGGAVAEELFAGGVSLPCSVGLGDADQERVIARLRA